MSSLIFTNNISKKSECFSLGHELSFKTIERVSSFHQSIPGYAPTPLRNLTALAEHLRVKSIYVKDESFRFDLNAFKFLGSSYALASEFLGENSGELTWNDLKRVASYKKELKLITATDGNHGHSVAYLAQELGFSAQILMPKGTANHRLERIRKLKGVKADIYDLDYDNCVELAKKIAYAQEDYLLIQDTAYEGYERIPSQIASGYSTIIMETMNQVPNFLDGLTHVFLQVGVGTFAAGVISTLLALYKRESTLNFPKIFLMEPLAANCLYLSCRNGEFTISQKDQETVMAGLHCETPSLSAFQILLDTADGAVASDDTLSFLGTRILNQPLGSDIRIVSGESGSIGVGILYEIALNPELLSIKAAMDINDSSRIFFVSTEGDTDPKGFLRAVWNGV